MAAPLKQEECDEDWIVGQAKAFHTSDAYAARAWLITGKTLFPHSFVIQFEAYNIEKSVSNTRLAASHLERLLHNFSQEPQLWQEVTHITNSLQEGANDQQSLFYQNAFQMLSKQVQYKLLLTAAEKTTDMIAYARLMLLFMYFFPSAVSDYGVKFVETLLSAEKQAKFATPVNCYRKLLVCDAFPLVLKNHVVTIPEKLLYRLVQKSIEFYITYVTQRPSGVGTGNQPGQSGLMSPTSGQYKRQSCIEGMPLKDSFISRPWESLFTVLELTAVKANWKLRDVFSSGMSKESLWQQVLVMSHEVDSDLTAGRDSSRQKELLHISTVLFLYCLYQYTAYIFPQLFDSAVGGPQYPGVLVEGFQTESATEQQESKKRKLSASHHMTPLVTISDTNHSAANTVMSFTTAVRCWELLHGNDCLRKDFTRICQIWKTDNWHWLQTFQVELLMYEGMYTEAIQKLQQDESTTWSIRCNLQKASCYYMLNNYVQCSSCTAEILQILNSTQEQQQQVQRSNRSQTTNMLSQPGPRRHLHLLITSRQNVLDYCVLLLTTCLKKRLYGSSTCGQQSDALLSSTLVMLQWNWPMEADTFIYIIDCIVQRACFTYKLFLNYVTNVDVLEEFAFLWKHHPNVVIDLLPISQAEIASKRALTRGVKQNASEDFKQAMIKQVASPCRDIEKLVQMFIISELETLQRALM